MIFELDDGRFFDPSYLLEDGLANGFPVDQARVDELVSSKAEATVDKARRNQQRGVIGRDLGQREGA